MMGLNEAVNYENKGDTKKQGEMFGERLRYAGVDVTALRIQGTIHDFVMLNSLDQTSACRAAMAAATECINCNGKAERVP